MRHAIIAVAIVGLGLSGPSYAENPVRLEDVKIQGASASGTCGPASVSVAGINNGWIGVVAGKIEVRNGGHRLVVGQSGEAFLEDRSVLACIDSNLGPRLVLLTFCDGRACPRSNYVVIDPGKAKILTPIGYGECPSSCAEEVLGMSLPKELKDGV